MAETSDLPRVGHVLAIAISEDTRSSLKIVMSGDFAQSMAFAPVGTKSNYAGFEVSIS
jgi:hypothetical protein